MLILESLKNKKEIITFFIMILFGVFMSFYPSIIRKNMIISMSKNMLETMEKLEGEELVQAHKRLNEILCGQYFTRNSVKETGFHDSEDFFETDFFKEPWREWKNSYFIWVDARNTYYILMLLFLLNSVRLHRKKIIRTGEED
jgi:hypothetical protein